jgi:hypothetical protein
MLGTLCRILVCCAELVSLLTIGVSYANDKSLLQSTFNSARNSPWYIHYQLGIASDSDFGPSLFFQIEQSQERSKLHSLSFGKRLSDTFYGRYLEVTAHLGVQYFAERGFQNNIVGTTAYWRLGRRTYLPYTKIPIKISLAQGISHVADIPTAEVRDFDPQNSAKLTHYLEYGLHYSFREHIAHNRSNLSHWFEDINVGYTIFHRSSVFGLFADKPGGINFPGIAIEFVIK